METGLNPKIMEEKESKVTEKNTIGDYFKFGEVAGYFFRKKDDKRPVNFSIRAMHGVNRLSMIIFLLAVIFLILKRLI